MGRSTITRSINSISVKSAVDVHHTFVQLQQAEQTGASEAEKEKLQEEAVKKGTDAIWKGSKLEIESKSFYMSREGERSLLGF